ncbi:hypothetical protein Terro_0390 [Terriglobus roseus DSM 18391]|uniref:Uncharacterized protein n=1 Tax=Terriglobus roseus (strain DSM 18391 / NRRL B-41598 / KBS 63) TaxID=926566 RepID=I3ZBX0_TERRK|nr:hypothetical protein [Terriglobus roseus]AFL86738.1 hypothetical protein Terro_0390 [Terriglobus roseus DSM 18391]
MAVRLSTILFLFTPSLSLLSQVPGRELTGLSATLTVRMEEEGASGVEPLARVQAQVQRWSEALGPIKPGSQPQIKHGAATTVAAWSVQFTNDAGFLHAFVTTAATSAVCHVRAQAGLKAMFSLTGALQRCSTELQSSAREYAKLNGGATPSPASPHRETDTSARSTTSSTRSPTNAPPKPVSADQPPAHPENWERVSEVLFRTSYGGGYGGMMIVQYEPLVLFRDGTYFEAYDTALEDLDLPQERQLRPVHWGTWKANGGTYLLSDNRGRPHDYKLQDGNLFRAFAAEQGGPLHKSYKSVSGGGNSAVGGDVGILVSSKMSFAADGRFNSGQDVGIIGSGNTSGVAIAGGSKKQSGVGSYRLHHHTIELRYPGGRSERRFFAYASHHDPALLDPEMVFLGDTPYINDK